MSSFIDNLSPKEWENFCETMLRQHFGAKNFYTVPDQDGGDLGIEFYTADGIIFQCYYPEQGIDMKQYKKRIQEKINEDLNKLKENEKKIAKLIDGIMIHLWVLLTPENKSKDLITYCHKKKREVIKKDISYIDADKFSAKIETAESYPSAKLYAQMVYNKVIDIPVKEVSATEKDSWKQCYSEYSNNITRKSDKLMGDNSDKFIDRVVTKYIQLEIFLEQLRTDHPDLLASVEDCARSQLDKMKDGSVLEYEFNREFVKSIVTRNEKAFAEYSKLMSKGNVQTLPFGYLSKWLAECYMDFEK